MQLYNRVRVICIPCILLFINEFIHFILSITRAPVLYVSLLNISLFYFLSISFFISYHPVRFSESDVHRSNSYNKNVYFIYLFFLLLFCSLIVMFILFIYIYIFKKGVQTGLKIMRILIEVFAVN